MTQSNAIRDFYTLSAIVQARSLVSRRRQLLSDKDTSREAQASNAAYRGDRPRQHSQASTKAGWSIVAAGLLNVVVSIVGCGHGDSVNADWRIRRDSASWFTIAPDRSMCTDCLQLSEVTAMGDARGPGVHVLSHWATRDSNMNYWIGTMEGPRVYSDDGRFLMAIGRSGVGPFEFTSAGPLFSDDSGRVHVIDQRRYREYVASRDGALLFTRALPGFVYEAAPIPGGSDLVVNSVWNSPDGIGYPLHIFRDEKFVVSFGMSKDVQVKLGTMQLLRRIAVDSSGLIHTGKYFEYVIEVWDQKGTRVMGLRRPGLWQPPVDGEPRPISRDTPPGGLLLALRPNSEDRLLVVTWLPRSDWLENVEEFSPRAGVVLLRPKNSNFSLYRTVIEVIDLRSLTVLASTEFPELIEGFLSNTEVYGNRFNKEGTPQLVVWKLTIQGSMPEGD